MADPIVKKISELTELTAVDAVDYVPIVDVSEPLSSDKTKRIKIENLKIYTSTQIEDGIVSNSKLTDGAVTEEKLASDAVDGSKIADAAISAEHFDDVTFAQNLIYIQLFGVTELVTTTTAKAYFWVPSYLTGKKIKKVGMGLVTAGGSNTTVALGSYASISGNGFVESDAINVSLPAAGTKIPINVTAGSGTPKGLDFWFVVGE